MKKTLIQGVLVVLLFFLVYTLFRQVDWLTVFKVEKITKKTEEKLGELFWEIIYKTEKEVKNDFVINTVDSIMIHLTTHNGMDMNKFKLRIIHKDEINAFALPAGYIILYSGLITESQKQEELIGVICHEIAHIELDHIMKKLIKEIGLSVLISMTTGGSGGEAMREAVKLLSSTAFDRNMEREADLKAVECMIKANINPEPYAYLLLRLSENEAYISKYLSWISTHPPSKERAKFILRYIEDKKPEKEQILTKGSWQKLQEELGK